VKVRKWVMYEKSENKKKWKNIKIKKVICIDDVVCGDDVGRFLKLRNAYDMKSLWSVVVKVVKLLNEL